MLIKIFAKLYVCIHVNLNLNYRVIKCLQSPLLKLSKIACLHCKKLQFFKDFVELCIFAETLS